MIERKSSLFFELFFYQNWKLSEVGNPLISLGFAPRINPSDFCGFFITATAWGQFKQKGDEEMRDGTAEVKYYDFFLYEVFFFAPVNSQSLKQTQFFADAVFRFHTTELKQVFMNLRYSLVFAVQENFSIQYPLWNFSDSFCSFSSFVFIMENYAYHSSLSSHVPHLP